MLLRPMDASGDILPVMYSSAMLSGPEAVALLVQDRLSLLQGEWWENPENGFFILETIRESRVTDADVASLSSMITAYIRETPGVRDVTNVRFAVEGRRLSWSCDVLTEEGNIPVNFEADL